MDVLVVERTNEHIGGLIDKFSWMDKINKCNRWYKQTHGYIDIYIIYTSTYLY